MKKILIILVVTFLSFVATTQAQKTFKAGDKIEGKTITQWAKEWDLQAFQETKEIYKAGMAQETFIALIRSNFPTQAKESFKDVFVPYYEYIYKFHSKGLTDAQVVGSVTGNETAAMITSVSAWNFYNPGQLPPAMSFPWKKALEALLEIIKIIITIL